jgi:hypothetical protein
VPNQLWQIDFTYLKVTGAVAIALAVGWLLGHPRRNRPLARFPQTLNCSTVP